MEIASFILPGIATTPGSQQELGIRWTLPSFSQLLDPHLPEREADSWERLDIKSSSCFPSQDPLVEWGALIDKQDTMTLRTEMHLAAKTADSLFFQTMTSDCYYTIPPRGCWPEGS